MKLYLRLFANNNITLLKVTFLSNHMKAKSSNTPMFMYMYIYVFHHLLSQLFAVSCISEVAPRTDKEMMPFAHIHSQALPTMRPHKLFCSFP